MSLALRIKGYVEFSFIIFPNGLTLDNIEKVVETYEGEYFHQGECQSGIVECMGFVKKPLLEQRDTTKWLSFYNEELFWKYKDGKYFLADTKIKISDDNKKILDNINKNPSKVKDYNKYIDFDLLNLINTLTNADKGISLNDLYSSFLNFNKKLNIYNQMAKTYSIDEETIIKESFINTMHFDYAKPYDSVYLDKKTNDKKERNNPFAHDFFDDWEYRNGLYYPNADWTKRNKGRIEKSKKTKESLIRTIEDKTLLNFINNYCVLSKKSNSEFLRDHLYMQANLDFVRKNLNKFSGNI